MAIFSPNLNKIKTSMRPKPEVGEMFLLDLIAKELNDDWFVYYQASIDGNHPDIILVCEFFGVIIIEVKDWNFDSYMIERQKNKDKWVLKSDNTHIKSPIDQVNEYRWILKDKLVSFNDIDDYKKIIRNIVGVVYFHNFSNIQIEHIKTTNEKCDYFIKLLNQYAITRDPLDKILNSYVSHKSKSFFDEKLVDSFKYIFKPSLNWMDTMFPNEKFYFNKKQAELATSKPEHIKFRGVAGSGKTFVLAKRAIDAFNKKGQKILILYYNITITNYFHDKISAFREDISWNAFDIIHFHSLIYQKIKHQFDIQGEFVNDIDGLLESIVDKIRGGFRLEQYSTILIDEGQDFELGWLNFIKNYLLEPNGEYVICADEKQNVYGMTLEDNKTKTNIPGRWNELNESYRLAGNIKLVIQNFQKKYFPDEDYFDEGNFKLSLLDPQIFYYPTVQDKIYDDVIEVINKMKDEKIKDNDICIITTRHSTLKSMSIKLNEHQYKHYYVKDDSNIKKGLFLNNDIIKLVTIKSFKGWESSSVILIIDDNLTAELLYTGMTRAFSNLHIVVSKSNYEGFFLEQEQIGLLKVIKKPTIEDLPF